jgi:hypothetical protein
MQTQTDLICTQRKKHGIVFSFRPQRITGILASSTNKESTTSTYTALPPKGQNYRHGDVTVPYLALINIQNCMEHLAIKVLWILQKIMYRKRTLGHWPRYQARFIDWTFQLVEYETIGWLHVVETSFTGRVLNNNSILCPDESNHPYAAQTPKSQIEFNLGASTPEMRERGTKSMEGNDVPKWGGAG